VTDHMTDYVILGAVLLVGVMEIVGAILERRVRQAWGELRDELAEESDICGARSAGADCIARGEAEENGEG